MSTQAVLFDAPGPKARRRVAVLNIIGGVVVLGVVVWVVIALARQGQFAAAKWQPFLNPQTWTSYLLVGLRNTVQAAAIAIVTANVFGLVFGMGRLSQIPIVRGVSTVVVEFFRAVPVLIMMIFFWYFLSFGGYVRGDRSPFLAVVIGLTLYNGSVIAELVRSGVTNLPKGQREAGLAIGLTAQKSLRIVELPQALIAMMPSIISQLVVILKDTGLGYIVTYPELLRQARLVGSSNANLLPALMVAAVMFVIINYSLTVVAERLSHTLSRRTAGKPVAGDPLLAAELD